MAIAAIASAVSGIVSPVTNLLQRRNDNKTALDAISAKAAAASVEAEASVTLSRAEWQLVGLKLTKDSWKDEFLCIVFSVPLFAGIDPWGLTRQIADNVHTLLGDQYPVIMLAIVGASFGIRLWKGK